MTLTVAMAMAMATAPMAYAQTTHTPPADTVRGARVETTAPTRIRSGEVRASKIIGSTVYDRQNQNIGHVKDIVLNKDGRVDVVVLDVGSFLGLGGKYVAVKIDEIKTDNDRLTLDITKDQLKQAEAYQLENKETGAGSSQSPVTGGHLGSSSGR